MAIAGGLLAGMIEPANALVAGDPVMALKWIANNYSGMHEVSGQWVFDMNSLKKGLLPLLAGYGVHKVASMVGVNRALGAAGIPLIRV